MTIKGKKIDISLFAAAAFAIAALLFIFSPSYRLVALSPFFYSFYGSMVALCPAFLAYAAFVRERQLLIPIAFTAQALLSLLCLLICRGFQFCYLLMFLGYGAAAVFSYVFFADRLQQYREKIRKFWFIPAAVLAVAFLFCGSLSGIFTGFFTRYARHYAYLGLCGLADLFLVAGTCLCLLWIAYPDGLPKRAPKAAPSADDGIERSVTSIAELGDMYCSMIKHILLLLFTFGIWDLIWIYRVTRYTNNVEGEEDRNPTTKLLLCMFVPFYSIYWTYKTAQRVDKMAKDRGILSDMATLCLIMSILFSIIPPILLQDKLNSIATANGEDASPANNATETQISETKNMVEELKSLKELLDSGIITQEEFDAKKSQLLGL